MKTNPTQRTAIGLAAFILAALLTLTLSYISTTAPRTDAYPMQIADPGGSQGNG
ncbi:MAG: hypothetical protein U0175_27970 [Caldilineaceae bacterium]